MSQEKPFNKNSEQESEFVNESWSSESDSEYESDTDSDYDEPDAKRCKIKELEPLLTDKSGHIVWYPGQRLNSFEIKASLGEGSFGRVFRVRNVNTGRQAAMKVVKNMPHTRRSAMMEVVALTLIECKDSSETSFCIKMLKWFNYDGHICIVLPLLGISVYDWLKKNDFQPYDINEVRHISFQLCSAVAFLHKNGIAHTDLKSENILLMDASFTTTFVEATGSTVRRLHSTNIRLSDFGNMTRVTDHHFPVISTRYYRAPEVILGLEWNDSCDIWSIGCTLVELYTGNLLFPAHRDDDLEHLAMIERTLGEIPLQMVHRSTRTFFEGGKLRWNWSEAAVDIEAYCRPLMEFQWAQNDADNELFNVIEQMLQHDPSQRIACEAALTQPFYKKLKPKQQV